MVLINKLIQSTVVGALLLNVCSFTNALEPKDIGAYHTKAFEMLGEKYKSGPPQDSLDVMMDMSNILSNFCHKEDPICETRIHEIMLKGFQMYRHGPPEVHYPEDFHPELKDHIHMVNETIGLIHGENLDEILDTLTEIHENILGLQNVNDAHKAIAVGASSIAIESTKLWHETFWQDDHPLHTYLQSHGSGSRKLQDIVLNFNYIPIIIRTDILGSINGTLNTYFSIPILFAAPYLIPYLLLYYGTVASTTISFHNFA